MRMRSTQQLRGQAFVVYRALKQAENALDALNAFKLFGKELDLYYAKAPSDETRLTLQQ